MIKKKKCCTLLPFWMFLLSFSSLFILSSSYSPLPSFASLSFLFLVNPFLPFLLQHLISIFFVHSLKLFRRHIHNIFSLNFVPSLLPVIFSIYLNQISFSIGYFFSFFFTIICMAYHSFGHSVNLILRIIISFFSTYLWPDSSPLCDSFYFLFYLDRFSNNIFYVLRELWMKRREDEVLMANLPCTDKSNLCQKIDKLS